MLFRSLRECSKNGGLKGLSGISEDMREIKEAIAKGNERARLARDKFIYDVKRYIGEFMVIMGGVNAIAFSGGIGQRDSDLRAEVINSLSFTGMIIDNHKNNKNETIITSSLSIVKGLVIETNEEIVVARETMKVINGSNPA